ncbi:MAG: NAD-dependent epimerase/dehydratase family protein [Chloroflexota bacterium]
MKLLVIGGTGFVSGAVVQEALARNAEVWIVTRGQRSIPAGVKALTVDRGDQVKFAQVIADTGQTWDLVVDCIGFEPEDAEQDIQVFRERAKQLVFVSTDFVYDPAHRQFPQAEESEYFLNPNSGEGSLAYGGKKRACELAFINSDTGDMMWMIVRPCHIYGPGSKLGCLPLHGRDDNLIAKLQSGETLKLVGGGHFLQQPIFSQDLAQVILNLYSNDQANREIFLTAGPDILESRQFYEIIADILGVPLKVEEVSVSQHLAKNPGQTPFMCHRIYSMSKLASFGDLPPSTSIEDGLRQHVQSLLANQ